MTKFEKLALKAVREIPGVKEATVERGGKHDKLIVVTETSRRMYALSLTPSDNYAVSQVVRLVKRDQLCAN